ncbi:MAG: AAA family ATPase [Nonlabens sp.]
MSEILKAFDSYGEIERQPLYTLLFDRLASSVVLEVPMDGTKANLENVLKVLDLSKKDYKIIYKNWTTEDTNNADFDKDFPYQHLFKSQEHKVLVWISLENDTLNVDFFYDCNDQLLEKWVIDKNHKLRSSFGLSITPTFNVLTRDRSYFETEDVRTERIEINIKENYNDDFIEIDKRITSAISTKESGLILLYGMPGTGKTTYIKSLISQYYEDSNFIFIQNEFVNHLLDPDFISFLLKQRNSILIIEDAEKVITSRENLKEESVVSTILQLTDGLFSDYLNIKIVSTFNTNLSKIDSALLRKGRLISMYEFGALTIEKTNKMLNKLGHEPVKEEMCISDIFNASDRKYSNLKNKKIGF